MRRIIVPPVPGLYSALGLLFADVEHQLACGFYRRVAAVSLGELNAAADALRAAGEAVLGRHGFPDEACRQITICADMKYVGQTSPLAVTFAAWPVTAHGLAELVRDFEALHQKTFGYVSPNEPMQFVALKAVCRGRSTQARIPKQLRCRDERSARRERRNAYFGPQCGWIATPVMRRGDLTDAWRDGPLIIEEYDATTVVRPGWRARLGPWDVVELVKG
jgi:N-methylhydantoinase A